MPVKRHIYDPDARRNNPLRRARIFKSTSNLSYSEFDLAAMAITNPGKIHQANALKGKMTPTEQAMEEVFNSDRFKDHPCYPQTIAFGYIIDFYFPLAGLAVEIDGPIHANQKAYDRRRDRHLSERGIFTIRFTNAQIASHPEHVISTIERKLLELRRIRVN